MKHFIYHFTCHKIVVHLPRHLLKVHDWPKHQACAAASRFNLRKKYSFSTAESAAAGNRKGKTNANEHGQKRRNKDYHEKRCCPMVGCSAVVKRLPAHLQTVHGFVKYAERKYVPQTIKSYFMSLRHFYSYVLAEKPVIDATTELVTQMMEKVKRWCSSYKRSSQKRKWENMEEDRVELVTPEKIQQFERSQTARDAVILLGKLSGAHSIEITESQYTLLRDFLLVPISINIATRAGVLSNMTVKEFERGYKEDDRFIMNVMKHKTFHVHGPAQVILTGNLQNWISIFIKQVRSKLPYITAEKEQPLFPSWNGKKLESGQISKAIQSVWKKAGIAGPIHSTLLRKGAVTVCHSSQKEMTSDLADLMPHKEDTAKRYTVLYYWLLAFQSVYYFVWNKYLDFRFSNLLWPLACT